MHLFLGACATTTRLDTIKNSRFDNITLERILIVAPYKDIGIRRETEYEFICQFMLSDVIGISSLELIPPLKEYTQSEIDNILDKNKIDAILVIALEDFWTEETYVPKSSITKGSMTWYGNSLKYNGYTQEFGGFYVSSPSVSFELRLYDKKSGEIIWLATTVTKGNALDNYKTLSNSLARESIKKLVEENVIQK